MTVLGGVGEGAEVAAAADDGAMVAPAPPPPFSSVPK
jgi:hypothetical protein